MKRNIMFDMAASIETEKSFEELSVSELVGVVCKRLHDILKENNIEAFGFCDEYEVNETPKPEKESILMEAALFALQNHYEDLAEHLDLSDEVLQPIKEQLDKHLND